MGEWWECEYEVGDGELAEGLDADARLPACAALAAASHLLINRHTSRGALTHAHTHARTHSALVGTDLPTLDHTLHAWALLSADPLCRPPSYQGWWCAGPTQDRHDVLR